jgi:hypothetical protein
MKRLALCTTGTVLTGVAYWHWGYRPCTPVPPGFFVRAGAAFAPVPPRDCAGPTFDNLLLLVMSLGIGLAVAAQLWWTRYYSPRGLGILYLLLTFAGVYFRTLVMPRLFGIPPITPFEFSLLRAFITWGAPLFLVGTLRWYWGRLKGKGYRALHIPELMQDEPPDT